MREWIFGIDELASTWLSSNPSSSFTNSTRFRLFLDLDRVGAEHRVFLIDRDLPLYLGLILESFVSESDSCVYNKMSDSYMEIVERHAVSFTIGAESRVALERRRLCFEISSSLLAELLLWEFRS